MRARRPRGRRGGGLSFKNVKGFIIWCVCVCTKNCRLGSLVCVCAVSYTHLDVYKRQYKGLESIFFYIERRWRFESNDKLGLESVLIDILIEMGVM